MNATVGASERLLRAFVEKLCRLDCDYQWPDGDDCSPFDPCPPCEARIVERLARLAS